MNVSVSENETLDTAPVEDFLAALTERNLHTGILGYRTPPEDGQDYIINTEDGDILLQVSRIVDSDFAFPITQGEYRSGKYSHFLSKAPAAPPWAIDLNRRDTSLRRSIQMKLATHDAASDHSVRWLLVFSTSGYPEIQCCVRGNTRDSDAVSMAREYLKNHQALIFDQIWFSNLVTLPVRIWPL